MKYHIPFSWGAIGRFLALIGSIGLAIANFFLIISVGHTYRVWELLGARSPNEVYVSFSQLIILYPLIVEGLLIGLCFICLTALLKGGFNKLKSYNEKGLISALIYGIIVGLIFGMIYGINFGIIVGLIFGMIYGIIFGIIGGIIIGITEELK